MNHEKWIYIDKEDNRLSADTIEELQRVVASHKKYLKERDEREKEEWK